MILTNLDTIPNQKFKLLGLVFAVGVPPMRIDWKMAEIDKVIEAGVKRANERMIKKAELLEADAIIKVSYEKETSELGIRVMVWGTAIKYI